jgi:hypothetical protein
MVWEPFKVLHSLKLLVPPRFPFANRLHLLHMNQTRNCNELQNLHLQEWCDGISPSKFHSFLVRFTISECVSRLNFDLAWSMWISGSWNVHWRYRSSISNVSFRQIECSCDWIQNRNCEWIRLFRMHITYICYIWIKFEFAPNWTICSYRESFANNSNSGISWRRVQILHFPQQNSYICYIRSRFEPARRWVGLVPAVVGSPSDWVSTNAVPTMLDDRFAEHWWRCFAECWREIVTSTSFMNIKNESTFKHDYHLWLRAGHSASDDPNAHNSSTIALRVPHSHHEWNTDERDFYTSVGIQCCCGDSQLFNRETIGALESRSVQECKANSSKIWHASGRWSSQEGNDVVQWSNPRYVIVNAYSFGPWE